MDQTVQEAEPGGFGVGDVGSAQIPSISVASLIGTGDL